MINSCINMMSLMTWQQKAYMSIKNSSIMDRLNYSIIFTCSSQGLTKKDVKKTINSIEMVCDERSILHEIPQYGMAETWKSMQPNPYVWDNLFKKSVPASLCAKTSLLRNPEPRMATKGRMLGLNTGQETRFITILMTRIQQIQTL